ncbi:MAG: TIGR04372 family glycosyltransferase [Parvibaculaceae bacterium]
MSSEKKVYSSSRALRQVSVGIARNRKVFVAGRKRKPPVEEFRAWAQKYFPYLLGSRLSHFAVRAVTYLVRWLLVVRSYLARAINRAFVRLAMMIYRLVYRNRRQVKAGTGELSDLLMDFQKSGYGIAFLRFTHYMSVNWIPVLGPIYFWLIQHMLVAAVGVHLASGKNVRALGLARIMSFLFRSAIKSKSGNVAKAYYETLRRMSMFSRIVREVPEYIETDDFYLNRVFGIGHLYSMRAATAVQFFEKVLTIHSSYYEYLMIGRAHLMNDNYDDAISSFGEAAKIFPPCVMSHQNYAGRYDVANYRPERWELENAGRLMVYDNLGQFAEEQFLHGNLATSLGIYQKMLDYQAVLAREIDVPARLRYFLKADFEAMDMTKPVRIFSYEWVIQFGHIGLLSAVVKMRKLGMMPDVNYVLLAPVNKTANEDFLRYWTPYFIIVRDPTLVDALYPYQRSQGENFMVASSVGGMAEPWTRKAARTQIAWARGAHEPILTLSEDDVAFGKERLTDLKVPEGAWYVGLHVREGGFYAETEGGMSDHRNSRIDDYYSSISEIVARGGIVIRVGDNSMTPLPLMDGVIDYAHSPLKSARMDMFLLATCRFLVGTTSGLTTAAQAFGASTLLVNCISNDWQLWDDATDFIVKRVYHRQSGRYLTLAETYRMPIQGYLMNNSVLERYGYFVHANSSEDILQAVRFKLDVELGIRSRDGQADMELLSRYHRTLEGNAFMFGAARPVPDFLASHTELIGEPLLDAYPAQQWPVECDFGAATVIGLHIVKGA